VGLNPANTVPLLGASLSGNTLTFNGDTHSYTNDKYFFRFTDEFTGLTITSILFLDFTFSFSIPLDIAYTTASMTVSLNFFDYFIFLG
jgi:hypothetical protein